MLVTSIFLLGITEQHNLHNYKMSKLIILSTMIMLQIDSQYMKTIFITSPSQAITSDESFAEINTVE